MIKPEVLDAMLAAGCSAEQIVAAVKADLSTVSPDAERARRYRSRGGGKIPEQMRESVLGRDNYECQECGSQDYLQLDHVHPVSKGGETTIENLQVLCRVCNARKKDRVRKSVQSSFHGISTEIHGNNQNKTESEERGETVSLSPVPLLSPTPPNNPLTPKPIQKNNSRGTRLPDDWQLSGPDLAYSLSKGLTEFETGNLAERFKSWALSANGPNAVKRNWHQAFQGWVQRDGPKIIAARAGPIAKPLTEFQRKQQETNDVRTMLRNARESLGSGGTIDRLLPDHHRERSEGLCGGTGSTLLALPGESGR